MSAREELQLMRGCLYDYAQHLANSVGGQIIDFGHSVICNPQMASKEKNMIVPARQLSLEEATELYEGIKGVFGSSNHWYLWTLFEQPHLAGLPISQAEEANPVMALSRADYISPPSIEGLEVVPVASNEMVLAFERVREEARDATFPDQPEPGMYLDERAITSRHHLWVGYLNGDPVATAAMFEGDGASMVKNVSVSEDARGLGIGKAMSAHVVERAPNTPVLDADGPAVTLYRSLGFHDIGVLQFWEAAG